MSDLTLLECEDSCCGHWPSDEGGLYDALEVDDYVASLQARIAELEMGNAKLDDNLARIKDADKSYSDLEAEICKLIDALQKEAHRADELEGSITDTNALINQMSKQIAELEQQVDDTATNYLEVVAGRDRRIAELESPWISVDERLPEDDKSVLLYFPTDAHRVGYWHFASDQFRCPNQPKWLVPPTHWMPLPQPPEE